MSALSQSSAHKAPDTAAHSAALDTYFRVLGPQIDQDPGTSKGFGSRAVAKKPEKGMSAVHPQPEHGLFTVKPLSPRIGAELHGIDLAKPVSDELAAAVRQALLDYKVIFFREQDITRKQHLDFARKFGELEVHPFANSDNETPEILHIRHDEKNAGKENGWHSDVTWRLEPSLGSILRAIEVPETGGDTMFADMYAAYEDLPDEVKGMIEGAVAVHDFEPFRRRLIANGASKEEIDAFNKQYPDAHHPVVRTHPETGRKALYVNVAFTRYIEGMSEEDSRAILHKLFAQAMVPEFQCRFVWRKNSIAFWDNRCTQHYAISDYWPQNRTMERATIIGDKPF